MSKQSDLVSVSQGASGDPLFIDTVNDRVGVGTSSPNLNTIGTVLHVNNGNVAHAALTRYTTGDTGSAATDGFDVGMWSDGDAFVWMRESANMRFATAGSERLRITSTGSVGIGTATPASSIGTGLHIATASGDALVLEKPTGASLQFRSDNTTVRSSIAGINGADGLTFATGAAQTERARIDASGNLLVAATSVPSSSVAGCRFSNPNAAAPTISRGSGTTEISMLTFQNGNGTVGQITTNGSATSYVTSSDYRLKENVVPLAGAADRLAQIPVHRFNFIADPDKTVDGFLAHEVQAFVPECVTGEKDQVETVDVKDEDGNVIGTEERPVYQGIDQSKLVPLLTAALQEALQKIDALETRISALETN